MGLLGTLGNIAKAPASLLWEGVKGLGHNFDRNSVGGLDELMGPALTPGLRRMLRAQAIGSMGNAIAGKETFGEGVAGNQNRVLGLWQIARQLKEQEAEKEMLRRAYDPQGGQQGGPQATTAAPQEAAPVNAPGDPGDPGMSAQAAPQQAAPAIKPGSSEHLMMEAQKEWRLSQYFQRQRGKTAEKRAELHAKNASQLRDDAEKLRVKFSGAPITLQGEDGKIHFGRLADDNTFHPIGGGLSEATEWAIGNDGENMFVFDKKNPAKQMIVRPMKLTPGEVATGNRADKSENRAERALQETIRGNVVSEGQRNRQIALAGSSNSLAERRLGLAGEEFAYRKQQDSDPAPAPLEKGAVDDAQFMLSARQKLDDALNVLGDKDKAKWMGWQGGLMTNPYLARGWQSIGVTKPQELEAYFELLRQDIGRAIERGVIHKDDVPKYRNILLTIEDHPAAAKSKINQLRTYIQKDFDKWEDTQRKSNRNTRRLWGDTTGGKSGLAFPGGPRVNKVTVDMGGGK
jgi:hypothetical protein